MRTLSLQWETVPYWHPAVGVNLKQCWLELNPNSVCTHRCTHNMFTCYTVCQENSHNSLETVEEGSFLSKPNSKDCQNRYLSFNRPVLTLIPTHGSKHHVTAELSDLIFFFFPRTIAVTWTRLIYLPVGWEWQHCFHPINGLPGFFADCIILCEPDSVAHKNSQGLAVSNEAVTMSNNNQIKFKVT